MAHIVVARALTARIARRFINIGSFIAGGLLVAMLLLTWALAHFFSSWWWLLLIPLVVAAVVLLAIRLLLLFIAGRIHHQKLSTEQTDQIDKFVDKIQSVLEARATPFPLIVLICLKDLLLHRDLVTVKSVIKDSASLMSDYRKLEKQL